MELFQYTFRDARMLRRNTGYWDKTSEHLNDRDFDKNDFIYTFAASDINITQKHKHSLSTKIIRK